MADTFGPVCFEGRGKTYCYHLLPHFRDEHPFTSCVDVWGSFNPWLHFKIRSMKQPPNFHWTNVDEAIKVGLFLSAFPKNWRVRPWPSNILACLTRH